MRPRLIIHPASHDEEVFVLKQGATSVGRTRDNDVSVLHKSLSRAHARFDFAAGRVVLTDLGSKNGTWVDGNRIDQCELGAANALRFGDVPASYESEPGPLPIEAAIAPSLTRSMVGDLTRMSLRDLLGVRESPAGGTALRLRPATVSERDSDKLRVLLKVSQLLSTPAPLDDLLASVLGLAFEILDIDRAGILMPHPETGQLEPRIFRTRTGPAEGSAAFSMSIARYVMDRSIAALFSDAAADARLTHAASVITQSIRTSMCAPLKARERMLGVLYVDNVTRVGRFVEEDLAFLSAFACQAANAIENALLGAKLATEAVSRNNLLRFFPPAALPAILQPGGGGLNAVEVPATGLFCDICGYTEMSSRMKPLELIELLNAYFPVMAEIVFRYEGTLEKYIGDALLAVWGAPMHHDDDAVRAVRAAIDMQRAIRALNVDWNGKYEIAIHVGINSGIVAAGNIGSKDYIQYATIGDATNVASRICGLADEGQIVLGGSMVEQVRQAGIALTALEPARVKGKDEPLSLYRVEWE